MAKSGGGFEDWLTIANENTRHEAGFLAFDH